MTALTDDEIDVARAATPGCGEVIHLNHAGASLPPQVVLDTQVAHLVAEASMGGYEAADAALARRTAVYESIGALIGAQPHEIARMEHATAAWNAAFWAVPMSSGQRIVVHDHEYGANIVAFLAAAERRGVVVERVPSDASGQVDVDAVADRLARFDVALVSLTHVPTNGGLVNPAAEIGALTTAAGVPFLLDACQSVGQRRIDVGEIGCDLLSATGRKYLRGPRGTGLLYVSDRIVDRLTPSHPDHHGAELITGDRFEWRTGARRFEHWEHSVAGWLGLGAAVDHGLGWGLDRIEATVTERAEQLRTMLVEAGLTVYDEGVDRCGIVTCATDAVAASELQRHLAGHGVNTTCTHEDSSRWDVDRRNLPPLLRLSVHYTTTVDELATAVGLLGAATRGR
ncbi:MAG TPA: aminotransferase class V-fold PLP-dependent enzyme [Ilumatobacteraceae bacterium]|nr:aminotransferase class V-fold PLP-dependent enzyme [Ilumatobacteraceae bacterium]